PIAPAAPKLSRNSRRVVIRGNKQRGRTRKKDFVPKSFFPCAPLFFLFFLFFFYFLGLFLFFLFRAFGLLHFQFAAQRFDDGQIRAIALAVPELDDAAVAAVPVRKAGSNRVEDFLGYGFPKKKRVKLAAGVKVIALAKCDHFFGKRSNLLCL